ncbi:Glycosyltransferase involved in cell wall bisynthesis [Nitrosomonas nitrosa]|uniref:Glycosyltransferase involved in cell wall bisynthesis n=1 Tax=Nitrosomonas nitrosa TaxID=52442 RepID=A0A1I4UM66_9PROT|nr:glycosyltransferase [Nitrosomonas nitrosa]SFM89803.1 Glycosyltransferase involved in cell wall bisynthesis [Nitrosomonas nitrosa]
MRILIVSPIASHPQNQGNSVRITTIGKQLQALGYTVHFLYYPLEGLTDQQHKDMTSCWDYFHTISCDLPNKEKTLGEYYCIDDWYDPRLGEFVRKLHERWHFSIVLVNYVWFSALLEILPSDIKKVIDTHDVFGNRHLRFTEKGMRPEWFYTTPEEEKHGLQRANLVIAIQNEEEFYFHSLLEGTNTKVITIGFLAPPRFLPPRPLPRIPVVGYLGSGNPFNVNSIKDFIASVKTNPIVSQSYRFVIAGTICEKLDILQEPFQSLGCIDDIEDFYASVDIVVNPMVGGSGLKIKSLEALSFGLPFIGTKDAMVGIPPKHYTHALAGVKEMVLALELILTEPGLLLEIGNNSRSCFNEYISMYSSNFSLYWV